MATCLQVSLMHCKVTKNDLKDDNDSKRPNVWLFVQLADEQQYYMRTPEVWW